MSSDLARHVVATWDDVRRIALALPQTNEGASRGLTAWQVNGKAFVWERPLRRNDVEALGEQAPEGPILGAHVEHLGAKEALLAANPNAFFTTPHFDGYAAVLARLDRISLADLEELILEAWLVRAPKRLAKEYLATRQATCPSWSSPGHSPGLFGGIPPSSRAIRHTRFRS